MPPPEKPAETCGSSCRRTSAHTKVECPTRRRGAKLEAAGSCSGLILTCSATPVKLIKISTGIPRQTFYLSSLSHPSPMKIHPSPTKVEYQITQVRYDEAPHRDQVLMYVAFEADFDIRNDTQSSEEQKYTGQLYSLHSS